VFFADGSIAGRLGEVMKDGFEVERDDGSKVKLALHSFDRVENGTVYLGCDSSNVSLFLVFDGAV